MESCTFRASLPPILSAMKVAGDGGARIQFDVPDSDLAEALKVLLWRDKILRITIEPVIDDGGQSAEKVGQSYI